MIVLETDRLRLSHLDDTDAAFMLELLNTPAWLQNIGDRNVKSLSDAKSCIEKYAASYKKHGFGMYRMELLKQRIAVGICGLVKRDYLEDVDIGLALLPAWEGVGLAFESADAVLNMARKDLDMPRVVAITTPANERSILLLEKVNMVKESTITIEDEPLLLFATQWNA